MITIESVASESKPRGARKATLTEKAAMELRVRIQCVRQEWALPGQERRLGPSAVAFLDSILKQLAAAAPRLSKKQRDTTEEILSQAFFGEPLIIMEGEPIARVKGLFRDAKGDCRVSRSDEEVMAYLKPKLDEPIVALSMKVWRIIQGIEQKMNRPPPFDIDGFSENDDPDGLPTQRRYAALEDAADTN